MTSDTDQASEESSLTNFFDDMDIFDKATTSMTFNPGALEALRTVVENGEFKDFIDYDADHATSVCLLLAASTNPEKKQLLAQALSEDDAIYTLCSHGKKDDVIAMLRDMPPEQQAQVLSGDNVIGYLCEYGKGYNVIEMLLGMEPAQQVPVLSKGIGYLCKNRQDDYVRRMLHDMEPEQQAQVRANNKRWYDDIMGTTDATFELATLAQ